MSVSSYRDLLIWQKSMVLVRQVYQGTSTYPKDELYALTNQIRRAAVSIPSNIAEGHAGPRRRSSCITSRSRWAHWRSSKRS